MPSPLVSTSGVVPSALYSWKVVPAGKLLPATRVMLNVSVPLPVLVTTLVKVTVLPAGAGPATVAPARVTPAVWVTVKGTVFDDTPVTLLAPLL